MPLTVTAPAESVTITDAQMIAALEKEGYTVTKQTVPSAPVLVSAK